MPNPLINAAYSSQGTTQKVPDRPVFNDPQLLAERGIVNPYRGIEDHGVPSHDPYNRPPEYGDVEGADWEPEPEAPTPVPVYIVSREGEGREQKQFRTFHDVVRPGDPPRAIVGKKDSRTALRITNISGQLNTGWITVFPRQTFSFPASSAYNAANIPVDQYSNARLVVKVYSITGTASPNISVGVYADDWNGAQATTGPALLSTGNITTAGTYQYSIGALAIDNIRAFLNVSGADTVADVEVRIYFTGANCPVYIGANQMQAQALSGYPLKASELSLVTQSEVYAWAPSTNPVNAEIAIYEEYTVKVD